MARRTECRPPCSQGITRPPPRLAGQEDEGQAHRRPPLSSSTWVRPVPRRSLSDDQGVERRRQDPRDLHPAGEARGSALLLAADGGCGHPGRGDPARRQADEGAPSDDGRREECGVRADDRLLGRAQKESREVARRLVATGTLPPPASGGSPIRPYGRAGGVPDGRSGSQQIAGYPTQGALPG